MLKLKQTLKRFPKTRSRLTAILVLMVLCVLSMGAVNDAAVKKVTLRDINVYENVDNSIVVKTRQATVGQLLSENNIVLGEYDKVNFSEAEELSDDSTVIVRRGIPITIATAEGTKVSSTTSMTVGEALAEIGVELSEPDEVDPPVETAVWAGMTVTVTRVTVEQTVVEENIPYTTSKKETDSLYKGETETVQRGENGLKSVTYAVTYKDGVEVDRTAIGEEVIYEPKEEIVNVGTKARDTLVQAAGDLPSRGSLRYRAAYKMRATAYDTSPSSNGGYSTTAMGTSLKKGVVAVDPSIIPLGSRLYIESADGGKSWVYGYAIASDTGGAIKGSRVDLCFNTSGEVHSFGVRNANVYVLE